MTQTSSPSISSSSGSWALAIIDLFQEDILISEKILITLFIFYFLDIGKDQNT